MRTLTADEIKLWLREHLIEEELAINGGSPAGNGIAFRVPPESRSQAHLARFLVNILGDFKTALVWIRGWNVWPSEENMVLVDMFRDFYGERRPLIESPGHEFVRTEIEQLTGLVRLCLAFGWDVYIFSGQKSDFAAFDHHGAGNLNLSNNLKICEAQSFLISNDWS